MEHQRWLHSKAANLVALGVIADLALAFFFPRIVEPSWWKGLNVEFVVSCFSLLRKTRTNVSAGFSCSFAVAASHLLEL